MLSLTKDIGSQPFEREHVGVGEDGLGDEETQ